MKVIDPNFQTPPPVVEYMVELVPSWAQDILEPTPGEGNIVKQLRKKGYKVTAPKDFFKIHGTRRIWDCVVMNPPFSFHHGFGYPKDLEKYGYQLGYHILQQCMQKTKNVIALMPWSTIINSQLRLNDIQRYGLKSITALPRKTFPSSRVQTCVLEIVFGYKEPTIFKTFNF